MASNPNASTFQHFPSFNVLFSANFMGGHNKFSFPGSWELWKEDQVKRMLFCLLTTITWNPALEQLSDIFWYLSSARRTAEIIFKQGFKTVLYDKGI